jgi:2'-hydroxyisoflavone reductase
MRLLVLGGTKFLGRGIVDAGLRSGDDVTTFTRGQHGEPPDGVEALHGDRIDPAGMDVLRGREWDAVVDTSGFVPKIVGRGAALLADSVGHYVFVSSLNAYPAFGEQPIRADSPVHDCAPDAGPEDGQFEIEQYGPFKVGSERAIDEHFAGRSAHLRAGLIIGPYDDSGRFPYWVGRMARGGEVLAPGRPETAIRLVDYRDLGAWAVEVARAKVTGAYVATGPADQITFGGMLAAAAENAGTEPAVTWVDDDWLVEQGVTPWSELPLWLPPKVMAYPWDQDTGPAEQAGLRTRPVAESARDTLAWLRSQQADGETNPITGKAGLDPARETELLAAWHAR